MEDPNGSLKWIFSNLGLSLNSSPRVPLSWQESKMAASMQHNYTIDPGLTGIQDGGLPAAQLLLTLGWYEPKMAASLRHNYTVDPGLTGIQDGGLPTAQLLLTLGWHESKMAASMWRSCCSSWAERNPRWRPLFCAATAYPGLTWSQDCGLPVVQLFWCPCANIIPRWRPQCGAAAANPWLTGSQDGGLPVVQIFWCPCANMNPWLRPPCGTAVADPGLTKI